MGRERHRAVRAEHLRDASSGRRVEVEAAPVEVRDVVRCERRLWSIEASRALSTRTYTKKLIAASTTAITSVNASVRRTRIGKRDT